MCARSCLAVWRRRLCARVPSLWPRVPPPPLSEVAMAETKWNSATAIVVNILIILIMIVWWIHVVAWSVRYQVPELMLSRERRLRETEPIEVVTCENYSDRYSLILAVLHREYAALATRDCNDAMPRESHTDDGHTVLHFTDTSFGLHADISCAFQSKT